MTSAAIAPRFNLETFDHLLFSYDPDTDIAVLHVGRPRPAVSSDVDDGWYLRLADHEIVGLELHGLKRLFLSIPSLASAFQPAIAELERFTGTRFFDAGDGHIRAEGSTAELPRTAHLMLLVIGQAMAKYEARRRAEYVAVSQDLLASLPPTPARPPTPPAPPSEVPPR